MWRHLWLLAALLAAALNLSAAQRPLSNSSSASFASGVALGPQSRVPTTNMPHIADPFAANGGYMMNSYYPGSYTGRSRNKDKFNELRNLSLMNNIRVGEPGISRDLRPPAYSTLSNFRDRQGDDPVNPDNSKDPVSNIKELLKGSVSIFFSKEFFHKI